MPSFSILKRSPKRQKGEGQNGVDGEDVQQDGNHTPASDHDQSKNTTPEIITSDDEKKERRGFKKRPADLLQDLRVRLVGKQPSTPQRGRGAGDAPGPAPHQRDTTVFGEVRKLPRFFGPISIVHSGHCTPCFPRILRSRLPAKRGRCPSPFSTVRCSGCFPRLSGCTIGAHIDCNCCMQAAIEQLQKKKEKLQLHLCLS